MTVVIGNVTPERHLLGRNRVAWAIKRKNQLSKSTCWKTNERTLTESNDPQQTAYTHFETLPKKLMVLRWIANWFKFWAVELTEVTSLLHRITYRVRIWSVMSYQLYDIRFCHVCHQPNETKLFLRYRDIAWKCKCRRQLANGEIYMKTLSANKKK